MNLIAVANETIKICSEGKYILDGKEIVFPDGKYDQAEVITPEMGAALIAEESNMPEDREKCRITVKNSDSFAAARSYDDALVMNFANAHNPGGGFRFGATAQEEALCRCSTLYSSIMSKTAAKMYKYNNSHINSVESDYMIISPDVLVFRDEKLNLLEHPFRTAVITVPAPNRYGAAALASSAKIEDTFMRRIRIILKVSAKRGYRNLVLGAWGCGAFGNKPDKVADYFRRAIIDEKLGCFFDEICFAIYGSEDGRNITAFRKVFE
ncbi:MAG: TIGR02452 family protein [Lachnospiraceae bacterium]|nr:TIGR02452 family protein [Lachnospiraceae bacterium]